MGRFFCCQRDSNSVFYTSFFITFCIGGFKGGFSVANATLTRFFTLHFLLPFVLAALRAVHLLFLHQTGSSNPLGVSRNLDKSPFHPYFSIKDVFGFVVFFFLDEGRLFLIPVGYRGSRKLYPC